MKMKCFFLIGLIFMLFASCASFKPNLSESGERNEAILNAILDFSQGRLYKHDSVFVVSFSDPVYKMILNKIDDGNYKWVNGETYDGMIGIGIRADYNKIILTPTKSHLPSRYIEKDGKLFYWWDDDYLLSEDAMAIFKKYNLLQDHEGGLITVPDFTTDETQKAVHYYFCKNNLTEYKKIVTTKGMGYYDPPKVKCNR